MGSLPPSKPPPARHRPAGRSSAALGTVVHASLDEDGGPRDALGYAVLALAHKRLGWASGARRALANAQRILTKMPDVSKGQTFKEDWHDWLIAQSLCREAEKELTK